MGARTSTWRTKTNTVTSTLTTVPSVWSNLKELAKRPTEQHSQQCLPDKRVKRASGEGSTSDYPRYFRLRVIPSLSSDFKVIVSFYRHKSRTGIVMIFSSVQGISFKIEFF